MWTTRKRQPLITEEVRQTLFNSIGRKCRDLGADIRALNAVEDHVHLLTKAPPAIAPAQFVRQVKAASSFTINRSGEDVMLYWQRGYGVLSLSSADLKRVAAYIENQQEHHRSGKVWGSLEDTEEEET